MDIPSWVTSRALQWFWADGLLLLGHGVRDAQL